MPLAGGQKEMTSIPVDESVCEKQKQQQQQQQQKLTIRF